MPSVIHIENATVYLSGRRVLKDIRWQVERGGRYFILGANGAGKTTLVRMLLGYAWPLFGATVEVLGKRFGGVNLQELRRHIAWVSPLMHRWLGDRDWTGREMVLSGPDATIGLFRTPTEAEEARAAELMESLRATDLMERPVSVMSSGEQVKVLIARALMTDPELMILDEPSVFLDIAGREFLLRTIAELAAARPELTLVFITQGGAYRAPAERGVRNEYPPDSRPQRSAVERYRITTLFCCAHPQTGPQVALSSGAGEHGEPHPRWRVGRGATHPRRAGADAPLPSGAQHGSRGRAGAGAHRYALREAG